jgi:hypothetical protein
MTDTTYPAALVHCADLATTAFAGFGDWRVPSAREALTLANSGRNADGLDQSVFANLGGNDWIWTATPYAGSPSTTELFLGGNFPIIQSELTTFATRGSRCVRGGPLPAAPLVVADAGDTVFDPKTSLTWDRSPAAAPLSWLDALAYCNASTVGGAADWRLPSYKELASILALDHIHPAMDEAAFPSTPLEIFWSSSPVGVMRSAAYFVDFDWAAAKLPRVDPMSQLHRVRCVRGGT